MSAAVLRFKIRDAWYGHPTDVDKRTTNAHDGTPAADYIDREFRVRGGLEVPGDLNAHFGDPAPGTVKVLSVAIACGSREERIVFLENDGGIWTWHEDYQR